MHTRGSLPRGSGRAWSRCPRGTFSRISRTNIAPAFCRPRVGARISIEQASTFGWERYVGPAGRMIGMHTFGASAPLKELQRKFGFEPERIVELARELVAEKRASA